MKFVKRISLFFVIPMGILCIGILCGMLVSGYFYPGENKVKQQEIAAVPQNSPDLEEPKDEKSVSVEAVDRLVLNSETVYVLEETDVTDGTVVESTLKLPDKYIGMSREEFLASMEIYELSPPLKEQKKGFIGLEVLSFSPEKVVVQMNYAFADAMKDYYILVEDHYLVVYLGDKKTLYMYTEIKLEELPQNIQQQVIDGMYMENEEKLFSFLESYSS